MLKAKIFSTTTTNALTSKKKKILASLVSTPHSYLTTHRGDAHTLYVEEVCYTSGV